MRRLPRVSSGLWLAALIAALSGGCSEATQLVVVIDSDLIVGTELVAVRAGASTEAAFSAGQEFDVVEVGLPFSFGVTPAYGADDEVVVTATGVGPSGTGIVSRQAVTSFVEGRAVLLELPLTRDCAFQEIDCGEDTCDGGGCVDAHLDPTALPETDPAADPTPIFDGPSPPRDAGRPDGGLGCVQDAPCDTGDPCVPGAMSCDTDLPECRPGEPLAPGTACGEGRSCHEEGECG